MLEGGWVREWRTAITHREGMSPLAVGDHRQGRHFISEAQQHGRSRCAILLR